MIKIKRIVVEETPVYDITVDEVHSFLANGIVVHNCAEIALPTRYYDSVLDLYKEDDSVNGEVALCNIGGIVYPNIESDEDLEKVAELILWLVDFGVNSSTYVLPHIGHTAKKRMSAGIGVVGLAECLAKNDLTFSTKEGKTHIHDLFEKHYWFLTKASLKLSK